MPLQPCRVCEKQVSSDAPTCPHCGAPDPVGAMAERQAAIQATLAEQQKANAQRMGVGCALLLGVPLVIWAAMLNFEPSEPEHSAIEAYIVCEQHVKSRLRSPGSADFPFFGGSEHTTSAGNGRYVVRSYVDAQNAFGGLLRTTFSCTVQWRPGDNWQLVDLQIDEG